MKILFFGTPDIAVKFLDKLLSNQEVVGVVTQPDKPSGRGKKIHPSPVKELAQKNNIPVIQPQKFTDEHINKIKVLKPDVGVAVSYGKLIPESIFTLPFYGCFNVHFSILPKYRGAGPIQWALINGEKETGVTTFWIEKTLDSGPILIQKKIDISGSDDAETLKEKLILLGIEAMRETLDKLSKNDCIGKPQQGEPSFAPMLKKEHGKIDWLDPAEKIINLIRGTKPWPGAYTTVKTGNSKGKTLKILKAKLLKGYATKQICFPDMPTSGQILAVEKDKGFVVLCGQDFILVEEVFPESKKPMPAWSFLQGSHLNPGDRLG